MRHAITLQYISKGTGSGYSNATMVFGPETAIETQKAWAKSTVQGIVSGSGSGHVTRIEVWEEDLYHHTYKAVYPHNLG
jgi:hypothetical protein